MPRFCVVVCEIMRDNNREAHLSMAEHQVLQALFDDEDSNENIRVSTLSNLVQFLHKSRMQSVMGPRDLFPTCIAYL